MKNLFFAFLFFPCFLQGQENCQGSFTEYYLNSNNIRASFLPRGNKFTSDNVGGFLVPYPSQKSLSTIYSSSPWMAGFDDAGNLKSAIETYPDINTGNFGVGPLQSIGIPFPDTVCSHFDKAWNVYAEDIAIHRMDFEEDLIIDDTIPSIFGWPSRGNQFFKRFNGFSLPDELNAHWAPFLDRNSNGLYDPDKGDFPILCQHCTEIVTPDQMMWMVFNDAVEGDSASERRPTRFEFQLTAFAFHCQDNEFLNNTIFNRYKIISKSVVPIDSVFFGMWADYDLGCASDDFIGSDSLRSTEYVYNSDEKDGDVEYDCTTGADTYSGIIPPIQSLTYLTHPMHSFINYTVGSKTPIEQYRLLNGTWEDGTPLRPEGDGYHQDPGLSPTRFLYGGDPRDSSSWSAINVLEEGSDVRTVSSVYLGRMNPGSIQIVDLAYTYHHDSTSNHLGQFTGMNSDIDSLLALDYSSKEPCLRYSLCLDEGCIWPGDFDHNGIADHRDYLMWGVFNGHTGPARDGMISWRSHPGEDWNEEFVGINVKHGDADGNGIVNEDDILVNRQNLFLTNRFYTGEIQYPKGSDIVVTADPLMDAQGSVNRVNVKANRQIDNLLGLTFELEFDTSLFEVNRFHSYHGDTTRLYFEEQYNPHVFRRFAFTKKNHLPVTLDSATQFFIALPANGIRLKSGLPIPDSTILRLRNLKAIDPDGNDLLLGSEPLVIYREGFVSIKDPTTPKSSVYPNPTNGHICIDTEIETEAELFSIQGHKLIHFNKYDVNRLIDVSGMQPGIYLLRIMATGETIKLIIQ